VATLASTYTNTVRVRDACVTPQMRIRARADGDIIDVQTLTPRTLTVNLSGTAEADSYLGCTATAIQTSRLVQESPKSVSETSLGRRVARGNVHDSKTTPAD
jgi:hypothetical protein